MIYLIEIGRYRRRGSFDKLFQKVVSVPDNRGTSAVKKYFEEKYEGFNVWVSRVDEVVDLYDDNPQDD